MRKYLFILIALLMATLVTVINAQVPAAKIIYNAQAFNTITNKTDTSAAYGLGYAGRVELATSTAGTDSCKIVVYVDGLIAGQWIQVHSDSLDYGDFVTTTKKAIGILLRGYGSNNIKGIELIRIRNTIIPFAVADSVSATSYSQHLILRE